MATVECVIPESVLRSGLVENLWLRDANWPGVRVIEMPLEKCLLVRDPKIP